MQFLIANVIATYLAECVASFRRLWVKNKSRLAIRRDLADFFWLSNEFAVSAHSLSGNKTQKIDPRVLKFAV